MTKTARMTTIAQKVADESWHFAQDGTPEPPLLPALRVTQERHRQALQALTRAARTSPPTPWPSPPVSPPCTATCQTPTR